MNKNSGPQTEALHRRILAQPGIVEHPKGHTDKVFRYQTRVGHELAVEKRKHNPVILVAASALRALPNSLNVTRVPAGRKGRNSNLNALPTFRDRPLLRLEVQGLSEADQLLSHLA